MMYLYTRKQTQKTMEHSPTISPSSFTPNKTGYKKYLKAIGIDYKEGEFNPFGLTFSQFKSEATNKITKIEKQLEDVTSYWNILLDKGQDDNDPNTEAYHCRMNARKLVYELQKLENND